MGSNLLLHLSEKLATIIVEIAMTPQINLQGNPIKWLFVILVILWIGGLIQIPIFNSALFHIFGRPFTIHHLLILLIVGYVIRFLPHMLQIAVSVLLILWLISIFFVVSLGGFANLFILILIVAILFSFF